MDPTDIMTERTARQWEAMSRMLCEMAGDNPDYIMPGGEPLWKLRMRAPEARRRIGTAIHMLRFG